jgi:dipeptidyl aminopeptidase/acylaminoacyl peptidase
MTRATRSRRIAAAIIALMAVPAAFGWAAIQVPDRPITDPRSIQSPVNREAGPVPIEDLAVSRGFMDAAWSADGRQVFIATNLTGRYNLWRVDAAGSWPLQLTNSDEAQSGLSPSPDGGLLLFTQDKGGDEYTDLFAVPTAGGPVRQLTMTPDLAEINPRFSPDGRQISLETKARSGAVFDVAVMDLATRRVRQLTAEPTNDMGWWVVGWLPDGRTLVADRIKADFSEGNIWQIDVATGTARPLTPAKPGVGTYATSISPDGRYLAVSSNEATGQMRAGLYDMTKQEFRWLRPTPWEQFSGSFSADGRWMITRTNQDGRSRLDLVDVATGAEQALDFPEGYNVEATSLTRAFAPDSNRLLILHSAANTPTEVWIANVARRTASPLTRLSIASLAPERLPRSEIVTYRSFDGTPVSAVLTVPFNLARDASNPAVVIPHGGPTGQAEDSYHRTATALASRGYLVIRPNFRGSTGYSLAFQTANAGDLGGGDLKDTVAVRDFLVATGFVDPEKIGITGGSYGGFLTLMALGRTPDSFAAGVQHYGIMDWRTFYDSADPMMQGWLVALLGDPARDPERYVASSPVTYIRNIKAPLLSLQGENDIRVPRSQAQQVADHLKTQGSVSEIVFYEDEGHGFLKVENQIDALRRTVEWFDRYLKGASPPAPR